MDTFKENLQVRHGWWGAGPTDGIGKAKTRGYLKGWDRQCWGKKKGMQNWGKGQVKIEPWVDDAKETCNKAESYTYHIKNNLADNEEDMSFFPVRSSVQGRAGLPRMQRIRWTPTTMITTRTTLRIYKFLSPHCKRKVTHLWVWLSCCCQGPKKTGESQESHVWFETSTMHMTRVVIFKPHKYGKDIYTNESVEQATLNTKALIGHRRDQCIIGKQALIFLVYSFCLFLLELFILLFCC